MIQRFFSLFLPLVLIAPAVAVAATPEPEEIVDRMIAAAGGKAFAKLGVIELEIEEEETMSDGTQSKKAYTAYADTSNLMNLRLEMLGGVVLGRFGDEAWATKDGTLDERRQTPYMANGALNQRLFPLLLPFSLKMDGVRITGVEETSWEGRDAWVLTLPFIKGFFTSPVLNTTWHLIVARDDASILAVEFVPSAEFLKVETEGIRYRILKYQDVEGAQVPAWFLLDGISVDRRESGHVRVTKIKTLVRGPWEPALFMHPKRLEAFEEN